MGISHQLPPRETSASQQRRITGCRSRLIPVVGRECLETRPANPRDGDALQHGQLRSGAAGAAVEEQPHVDGLAIRIDSELARTPEAAREATAPTAPHELTILGSHCGALALVAVPEKAPLPGAGRRSPLAAGTDHRGLLPCEAQRDVGGSKLKSSSDRGAGAGQEDRFRECDDRDRKQRSSIDPQGVRSLDFVFELHAIRHTCQ